MYKLLEQLDELIDRSNRVPITGKIMVDEHTVLNILDALQKTVPEEIQQAHVIIDERERILTDARNEGREILKQAQAKAEQMVNEDEVRRKGQAQAEEMVAQAQTYFLEMKRNALVYSNDILQKTEGALDSLMRQVQSNRGELLVLAQEEAKQ
jgi:vacuolar-type H+-ATPase subunit H